MHLHKHSVLLRSVLQAIHQRQTCIKCQACEDMKTLQLVAFQSKHNADHYRVIPPFHLPLMYRGISLHVSLP
eukprot:2589319-Amphidinium_carterae.1